LDVHTRTPSFTCSQSFTTDPEGWRNRTLQKITQKNEEIKDVAPQTNEEFSLNDTSTTYQDPKETKRSGSTYPR
jgi:hypothetical protein